MAASPEYLILLDAQAELSHMPTTTFQSLDEYWNTVVNDRDEASLIDLADAAIDLIVKEHGTATRRTVAELMRDLHIRKNAGYAGADNLDPWANFRMAEAIGISAFDGVLVRMGDKYIRLTNLRRNPDNEQTGESILDTLIDLAAYALIAVCLLREERREETAA